MKQTKEKLLISWIGAHTNVPIAAFAFIWFHVIIHNQTQENASWSAKAGVMKYLPRQVAWRAGRLHTTIQCRALSTTLPVWSEAPKQKAAVHTKKFSDKRPGKPKSEPKTAAKLDARSRADSVSCILEIDYLA